MEFKVTSRPVEKLDGEMLVLFTFADMATPQEKQLDKLLEGKINQLKGNKDFVAEKSTTQILYSDNVPKKVLLVGLGAEKEINPEGFRVSVGSAVQVLKRLPNKTVTVLLPKVARLNSERSAQLVVETVVLAGYEFNEYKSEKTKLTEFETITLNVINKSEAAGARKGAQVGHAFAGGTNLARDLGNHPANTATPTHLAEHALKLSKDHKDIKVKVLNKAEIKKERMGALLAVAQGSQEEPKFIELKYQKKKTAPLVALAGKGVTFDSGGISIKPSERMEEMKNDMAGAATVLGIFKAAAELKLPFNLIGLIPTTENLPSSTAVKPGDIIKARSGKNIEVINTDAEGRLILSDALDYAKQYKPDLVIDFATLTGAMVVALGFELIGSFANKKPLNDQMVKASERTGEKVWPMPLEDEYDQLIKSQAADIRNIATAPYGGAITAALFLKHFVDYPWIHLDIAGPAMAQQPKSYRPKGATGVGVRLALDFLQNYKK